MPTSASPPARKGFDYASLDAETTQFVQQQTGEIRVLMKRTAQGIVEIGSRLLEVKARLGYGRFEDWLEAEFEWSRSAAAKFMQVSDQFRNVKFTELDIAPSALYILAAPSTSEAVRQEALSRAQAGEPITYTTAQAIKQKYTPPSRKTRPEPELELEPEPEPELEPISKTQLTPGSLSQSGSKLEIVSIRPHGHTQALSEASRTVIPQSSAQALSASVLSQPVESPDVPGIWWRLGGQHLLYCGEPNSSEFLERITEEVQLVQLLLAFPLNVDWQPAIRARARIIVDQFLPQAKNLDQLDEVLESLLLFYSRIDDPVIGCFVPSPEILSIINRLGRRGLFAEPDSRRCHAVISDWRKAGLKAERLS